jgi:hypothetical protein
MKSAAPDFAAAAMSAEDYGAFGAEYRFAPVEEMSDPGLKYLYACWNELRGERDMPPREELSPRALGPMLRYVQMFEVIDGGRDFRCRVYGTGIAEVTGLQITGRCMSEFDNVRLRSRMTAALHRVFETHAPVRMFGEQSALAHIRHKQVDTLWLPLGGREGVTHILSGVAFPTAPAAI